MRAHQEFKVIDSHSGGAPSRLVLSGVPQLAGASVMVEIPGFGMVQLDVSYGGNFYAIMDAAQFDLDLAPDTVDRAVGIAAAAHRAVNSELEVQHPALPSIRGVTHVQLFNGRSRTAGPPGSW